MKVGYRIVTVIIEANHRIRLLGAWNGLNYLADNSTGTDLSLVFGRLIQHHQLFLFQTLLILLLPQPVLHQPIL